MAVNDSVPEKPFYRFRGRHLITLDHKGRFNVPAKIRKVMEKNYGEEMEVTVSVQENYLLVYPVIMSSKIAEKYDALDENDEKKRTTQRVVFMEEEDCEIKSGKILCPARFRKKVGLKNGDEAVVVGANRSFEVWPRGLLEEIYGPIEF